jgi:hypothetical protein
MLDWVSLLLSVFGLTRDRAERIDGRRAEAFRLAAEVSGEVGKALDLIEHQTARLVTRCAQLLPGDQAAVDSCSGAMAKIRADALQLQDLVAKVKKQMVRANGRSDWSRFIRDLNEWSATASRLVPWIEGVVARLDAVLDGAGPASGAAEAVD